MADDPITGPLIDKPTCPCEKPRHRAPAELPGIMFCSSCSGRWMYRGEKGWEVLQEPESTESTPAAEPAPDTQEAPEKMTEKKNDYACIKDGCPGIPKVEQIAPGKHAMKCPTCWASGPVEDSEKAAVSEWTALYPMEGGEGAEVPPFLFYQAEKLEHMREKYPPLESAMAGLFYLESKVDAFKRWLRLPPDERKNKHGLYVLLKTAATCQRMAEDLGYMEAMNEEPEEEKEKAEG